MTPERLAAYNLTPVRPTPPPRPAAGEIVVEAAPALLDGVWVQQWTTAPAPPPAPAPVPETVTPLQARRALRAAGLLAQVEALVAEAPEDVREAWEYAVELRRDDPTLRALAAQLQLHDSALDDLFRAAAAV